jgi:hypothetical protein
MKERMKSRPIILTRTVSIVRIKDIGFPPSSPG